MAEPDIVIPVKDLNKKISIPVNGKSPFVIQIKRSTVHILEMEDVLFHLNSAVLMPENPEGISVGGASEDQVKVTGIRALALTLKQVQSNPKQKLLVAGHTDRSGEAEYNFELSELRAQSVMYLLKGKKEEWTQLCERKHKVEDCQQILQYYSVSLGWDCDPGKVDNTWGAKTEHATRNFIILYNYSFAYKPDPKAFIDETLGDTIANDSSHTWPKELWGAVYDLYQCDIMQAVTGKKTADEEFTKIRDSLMDMDPAHPFVGCGESFPISDKSSYRSQTDRRVEILFFDEDEAITLTCPDRKSSVHEQGECILQNRNCFITQYIDPGTCFTAHYHLQFLYFDAIYGDYKPIPKGLPIKVFKDRETEIQSRIKYENTTYEIAAIGLTDSPREKDIHFSFELQDAWIYTKDSSTEPVIMIRAQIEKAIAKKFEELTAKELQHYVPVAPKWDSRNWPCVLNGKEADFSEQVMQQTAKDQSIIFNMNMLVLVEKKGASQAIKDADHFDTPKDLDKGKSRVKIFTIDPSDATLSLYKTDADEKSSRIPFGRNCITEKAKNIACVFFNNGFYVPSNSHTVEENKWLENGFCIGARAAIKEDKEKQVSWEMFHNENEHAYTGDYDVHYLHHLYHLNNNPVSYAVIYVSINFMRDCGVGPFPIPTQADVDNFIDKGVYNAMERFNGKKYFFEELNPGDDTTIIRPFYFFDERETFSIPDTDQPTGINFDDYGQASTLMTNPAVTKSRKAAFGGKPKFLAMIIKDSDPINNYGSAYHWSIRDNSGNYDFSLFKLNQSAYDSFNSAFPGFPATEYGSSYGIFTFAHELGHATSLADEYLKSKQCIAGQSRYPEIEQYTEHYSMDQNDKSLMYHNGVPRLHHLWYHVHSINNQIDGGVLKKLISGKVFRIKYENDESTLIYHRPLSGVLAVKRDLRVPDKRNEQYELFKSGNVLKRLYLALYSVGQDESSINNFHKNQNNFEYNGVLCVRVFLNFKFDGSWTDSEKEYKMSLFKTAWDLKNGKYRMVNGNSPFKNIFIYFLTGYTVSGEPNINKCNYTVRFSKIESVTSGNTSIIPDLSTLPEDLAPRVNVELAAKKITYTGRMSDHHYNILSGLFSLDSDKSVITDIRNRSRSVNRIANNNGTLLVPNDVSMPELNLYILNMDNNDNEFTGLQFLKSWTEHQTGGNYLMEEIITR